MVAVIIKRVLFLTSSSFAMSGWRCLRLTLNLPLASGGWVCSIWWSIRKVCSIWSCHAVVTCACGHVCVHVIMLFYHDVSCLTDMYKWLWSCGIWSCQLNSALYPIMCIFNVDNTWENHGSMICKCIAILLKLEWI